MGGRQRFDTALDLLRQVLDLFRAPGGQAHDRGQDGKQIVGAMAQFIRHPVVFHDRIARSQQLADIPLRPEEIFELALGIVDRPDVNRVPEGCAILAVVQDIDHGINALFHRAAQARHGRRRGLLPLEKTAIAPDDLVDRIAREFDEGVVAINDGAIGLMGIGNALRHPGLRGGLQEQLIGGETQRG